MNTKFRLILVSIFFLGLIGILTWSSPVDADEHDYYLELKKSWLYMQRVYEHLNQHYVEEIAPYPLIKAGIEGMLEKLDPYTVFIDEEGERRLQMITTGKYGGLGMEIGLRNKKITVISPLENSPAKKMGVLAGDIIEKIDGKDISGWSVDKVSSSLRGKIGSSVTLLIRRPGLEKPYEITMTRAEIIIEDVGYAGFLDTGIAYVSLIGFTEKASTELKSAIRKLQNEQDIKAFILDLRGNPGGLLESAVDIVNVFVDKNELVVYTKGFREEEAKFYTRLKPILEDIPLIVLVDQGSASASEIVAGALQDLDRAVIIGESTFGKGLVQKVFPIDKDDEVKLKITTAKYYVPSGRCIQKRDYTSNNGVITQDSLRQSDTNPQEFFTRNKRKVFDKGGIYPDIEVATDSLSFAVLELIRKSFFFDFAVHYHSRQPNWEAKASLADSILNQFNEFVKNRNFVFELEGSREIQRLEVIADQKLYAQEIKDLIQSLKKKIESEKLNEYKNNQEKIREMLRLELAEKYYGERERERLALENDRQIDEALKVLKNRSRYGEILAIN